MFSFLFLDPPTVPRNLIRLRSTKSSITVKWERPKDTGSVPFISFALEVGIDKDLYSVNYSITGSRKELKEYEHTFRHLTANIIYTVRVSAYNTFGKGAAVTKKFKTVIYSRPCE